MKAAASVMRWGILGTNAAAQQFALGLAYLGDARLLAVGAHSPGAAEVFGESNWVPHRHSSFTALADDPDVDVVFIATPPAMHSGHVRMCLLAGKAVVCALPFTTGADAAAELLALAREQKLFLMAGPWMRFLPLMARLRALLAEGMLGELHLLTADIGVRPPFASAEQPHDARLDRASLADAGATLSALALMCFGAPTQISGAAHLGTANGQAAAIVQHAGGQLSTLTASTRTNAPQEATIIGDTGWVRIHSRWYAPEAFTLAAGVSQQVVHVPTAGTIASYAADEAMRCLRAGRLESAMMPLDETLAIMWTLDQLCEQWGLAASESVHGW
jgi:predicted dehydrogenase